MMMKALDPHEATCCGLRSKPSIAEWRQEFDGYLFASNNPPFIVDDAIIHSEALDRHGPEDPTDESWDQAIEATLAEWAETGWQDDYAEPGLTQVAWLACGSK